MFQLIRCPSCNSDRIKTIRGERTGEFQEITFTVHDLEYHECPDCGEKCYDREAMRKIGSASPAFEKVS